MQRMKEVVKAGGAIQFVKHDGTGKREDMGGMQRMKEVVKAGGAIQYVKHDGTGKRKDMGGCRG